MSTVKVFKGKKILPGKASGSALVSRKRIGLRGFVNLENGTFTGGMRDLEGVSFAGTVLIFPSSKGSTLWPIELDHTCRFGNSPAAMIISNMDPFVVLGCVLQDIPLVQVEDLSIFEEIKNGDAVTVDADRGEVTKCLA
jgi:hypothetical protein